MAATCRRCKKTFSCSKALYRHERETKAHRDASTTAESGYSCATCNKTFTRAYDLLRHKQERESNGKRLAPSCSRRSKFKAPQKEKRTKRNRKTSQKMHVNAQPRFQPSVEAQTSIVRRADPQDLKPWICGICRNSFAIENAAPIYEHLKTHFTNDPKSQRCEECEINFTHEADLRQHLRAAGQGNCGFRFDHVDPCTGHHPPGRDHGSMWYRVRHWEQCQLESYIHSTTALRARCLDLILTNTEYASTCHACTILEFFQKRFPEQHGSCFSRHLKSHRKANVEARPHSQIIDHTEIQELIRTLTGRRRRASSLGAIEDVKSYSGTIKDELDLSSEQLQQNIAQVRDADFVDASYLANPLQGTLHWAACAGDRETVQHCIMNGADIHGVDMGGRTAVHWAAASGSTQTLELLIEHGASVESKDVDDQTPLLVAISYRRLDCIESLLQLHNDGQFIDSQGGVLLREAVESGDVPLVNMLVIHGCDINAGDWFGQTPLLLAIKQGRLDLVEALCDLSADIELSDDSSRTPLMSSIDFKLFDITHCLLGRGATVTNDMIALASRREGSDELIGLLQAQVSHEQELQHDV